MSDKESLLEYRVKTLEKALAEKEADLKAIKKEVNELSDALKMAKIVARVFGGFIIGGALFMDQLQMWINRLFGR